MVAEANPHLLRLFRAFSRVVGWAALGVGGLVLVGWLFDIPALRGVLPGFVTMKFNTALCFALAGIALWLQGDSGQPWRQRVAQISAVAIAVVGLLTFSEYLGGWDLGIDQWVVRESASALQAFYPGRMAPLTAVDFVLLGSGLWLLGRHSYRAAQGLALLATGLSLLAVVGYLYGVEKLYRVSVYTAVAPTTALTLLALGLGVLAIRPDRGLLAVIITRSAGGAMVRRLFPVSILLPILVGWLVLQGLYSGLYDAAFGTSLVALTSAIIVTTVIWLNAHAVHRMDEALRHSRDDLELRVQERTAELKATNLHLEDEVWHRQQAEQGLAEERNLLRTLIDSLPDIIYIKDRQSHFVNTNVAMALSLGLTAADRIIGKSDADFHPPELAARYLADEQAIFATGQPLVSHEEPAFDHRTGQLGWFMSTKVPLRNSQGEITGLVGIGRDITARKGAEEALDKERRLLRTLIDSLPDYIFTKDRAGRFVISNVAHARAAQRASPEELVGKTAFEVFPAEFAGQFHADDLAIMESGQPLINLERVTVDEEGHQRAVLTTKMPLRDGSGAIVGLVGVSRDISDRRRVEQALRDSETRLAGILESAHEAVISLDETQRIILYNSGAEHVFGFSRDEIIGQPLDMLLSDRVQFIHRRHIAEFAGTPVIARRMGERQEIYGRRKDGHEFPAEASISKLKVEGHLVLTVVLRDITERKQAEEALRKTQVAEHEQRVLAETLRDTALALTGKLEPEAVMNNILVNIGRVVPHDAADIMLIQGEGVHLVAWHGYPPESEAALKELTFSLNMPNIRDMLRTRAPVLLSDTEANPGWIRTSGTAWIRASVGAPIQVHGQVVGFLNLNSAQPGFFTPAHAERLHTFAAQAGIAIDNARLAEALRWHATELEQRVDERTRELQQAKDDIEAVLNHSSDAILVVHADSAIRRVNPTVSDLFGFPPDRLLGQPLSILVAAEYVERLNTALTSVVRGGPTARIEIEAHHQNGTRFNADVGLSPIRHEGEVAAPEMVCSIRDITELKRVERELQELSRLKTEFLTTAAHELRTPLTSILGFSELLLTRSLDADRGKRYLQIIYEQSVQLQKIINALLDVSRLEANQRLALDLQPIHLSDLVSNALTPFTESSPEHRFQVEGLSTCPSIVGDPFRLNQVLQNLLSNAVKYSPAGGTVTVHGQVVPGFVQVRVQDEGIGMTAEQQSHLFERFYRADASNTTISGTGLGLAIAKLIVELHGGSIRVESKQQVGTVVYFTLPLSSG